MNEIDERTIFILQNGRTFYVLEMVLRHMHIYKLDNYAEIKVIYNTEYVFSDNSHSVVDISINHFPTYLKYVYNYALLCKTFSSRFK